MSARSEEARVSTNSLSTRVPRPAVWLAQNLALLFGVSLILNELFPSIAHARRGIPLFIIISDNPWVMAIGVVLLIVWAYFRFKD